MMTRLHVANAVTVTRIVLTPAFLWFVWRASRGDPNWTAAGIYSLVALTDTLDGRLARWLGSSSRTGRLLDNAADIAFLLPSLAVCARVGLVPWWVPASVAASFLVYALDSWARGPSEDSRIDLHGTWIGHAGGVANYILVGILVFDRVSGLHALPERLLGAFFILVPIYSGAAILQRLMVRGRRSAGCPRPL